MTIIMRYHFNYKNNILGNLFYESINNKTTMGNIDNARV